MTNKESPDNRPSLLIVDDDEKNLYALRKILEEIDISIHAVVSGEDALKAIVNQEFFLVLMDVHMPDMDGFETISLMRGNENYKNIPVIFITAQTEEKFIAATYEEGVVDIIFKPIVLTYPLICKVKVFLELYLNRKELERRTVQLASNVVEQTLLREIVSKSKRDLQSIMDHSPAVIYVKDINGCYVFINRQYEKLFKIRREDIIGKTDYDLLGKEIADKYQQDDASVLETGRVLEVEVAIPEDGNHRSFIAIKFPLFDENNEIYAVCSTSTDITERKLQEEQLRRSQKMDALGKLTGGIAHDYNNILGIILGYAEQINAHANDVEKVSKFSEVITRTAERGSKLAQKLLAFSRYKKPDLTVININILLQDQRDLLQKTLTVRIKLSLKLSKDLWSVELDSDDLEDAIINMCVNALYAMKDSGQLIISTSNETLNEIDAQHLGLSAGEFVLLSIADTGCGMNAVTREKIFDPFYSTKGELGTGLGLSQVYGFLQRSAGAIKVYSELGQGSRFALFFPRNDQAITKVKTAPLANSQDLSGNETLLVVDDEQAMVDLAVAIFTAQGYHVLTANNGKQALAVLEKESVDLVISDVVMPNMDGYQLAEHVQRLYPDIKLQMISGFADDRHIGMMDKTLHENMLLKPYSSNVLLSRVRRFLDENGAGDVPARRTILVMDDNEDIQALYEINLQKLGYNVITVFNGEDAIDCYKNALGTDNPIDVMIVDLTIPGGMGGNEVRDEIRKIHPDAKIIVTSGNSVGPEMMAPRDCGFDGALEKNFNREAMLSVLKQVLV